MNKYQKEHHREPEYRKQKASTNRRWRLQGRDSSEFRSRRNDLAKVWLDKNPGLAYAYYRKHAKLHPERLRVYKKVGYAVRTGKLIKPENCSVCLLPAKVHAHHEDYGKPLDVIWMCAVCHGKTRRVL